MTVCIFLLEPTMASVGQALIHRVQPMHQASSMKATLRGAYTPWSALKGTTAWPVMAARRETPSAPPGGHWLMAASLWAMACA